MSTETTNAAKSLSQRISDAREELDMFGTSPSVEDLLDWMIEVQSMEANETGLTPRMMMERLTKCAWELEKARQELVSCKPYLSQMAMEIADDRITRIELFLSTLNLPTDGK
jgi:hypothetical protein